MNKSSFSSSVSSSGLSFGSSGSSYGSSTSSSAKTYEKYTNCDACLDKFNCKPCEEPNSILPESIPRFYKSEFEFRKKECICKECILRPVCEIISTCQDKKDEYIKINKQLENEKFLKKLWNRTAKYVGKMFEE